MLSHLQYLNNLAPTPPPPPPPPVPPGPLPSGGGGGGGWPWRFSYPDPAYLQTYTWEIEPPADALSLLDEIVQAHDQGQPSPHPELEAILRSPPEPWEPPEVRALRRRLFELEALYEAQSKELAWTRQGLAWTTEELTWTTRESDRLRRQRDLLLVAAAILALYLSFRRGR